MYKCQVCGRQFRQVSIPGDDELWAMYQEGKQTMEELAEKSGVSHSTIKRRFRNMVKTWEQPTLSGGGFVHIDATYWGHSWGILLAIDDATSTVLYLSFIRHETVEDYRVAIASIESRGYRIDGIVIDGMQSLFKEFSGYPIQMCHFHMISIIRRYLTKNPRLRASRELRGLVFTITTTDKATFEREFCNWKERHAAVINRRTVSKRTGESRFTHKRLRTAMHSVEFYLPYLFTFQREDCHGMPNTNNKIEGTFTDLKNNLNNHSGMSKENRKRFICGFFWHRTQSNMSKQTGTTCIGGGAC